MVSSLVLAVSLLNCPNVTTSFGPELSNKHMSCNVIIIDKLKIGSGSTKFKARFFVRIRMFKSYGLFVLQKITVTRIAN